MPSMISRWSFAVAFGRRLVAGLTVLLETLPVARPSRAAALAVLLGTLPAGLSARAELPQPLLTAIHPAGGQRGTEVTVTVSGADLDEVRGMLFAHPGIVARPVLPAPTEFDPEPRPVPGKLLVSIAADVPPGIYDAAVVGRFGVSNPRAFAVGVAPQVIKEKECDSPAAALAVPTDATVAGRATAAKADHYALDLAAGQRIHLEAWCRRLDSRMVPVLELVDPAGKVIAVARGTRQDDPFIDIAVPGAGRHVVRIHDLFAGGGEEWCYRLTCSTGPWIDFVFPPAGRPGEALRVEVFGRGLPGGSPALIEGGNAGLESVVVDARLAAPAAGAAARFNWRLFSPRDAAASLADLGGGPLDGGPQPLPALAVAAPVIREHEPNDDPAAPQAIEVPGCVAGRFQPRHDRDWYAFTAKAGDVLWLEVTSARLGLPTDPALVVESLSTDAAGRPVGKEVAAADDGPGDFAGPLVDRPSADPVLEFKAPADGTYRVLVRDLTADSVAAPHHVYVLEVRRPVPDFEVVALLAHPNRADANRQQLATLSLPVGGALPIDILVVRKDGFSADVTVTAEGLPAGVTAPPLSIPARANRGTLVLTAAEGSAPAAGTFRIEAKVRSGDTDLVRVARPATLRWNVDNANQPQVLRMVREIPLAVIPDAAPLSVAEQDRAVRETARGGKVSVPLALVRRPGAKGAVSLTAAGLPGELKVAEVKIEEAATAASAEIDVDPKLPPGQYQIVLRGVAKTAFARNPEAAARLKADAERIAALAQQRTTAVAGAKQALAAAEEKIAAVKGMGTEPPAEVVAARDAAARAVADAEGLAKAAAEEQARREKLAADAATASAAKDTDVPLVVPSITLVVTESPVTLDGLPAEVKVTAGGMVDLAVACQRKYGFAGEVVVEAAPAKPVAGLTLAPVTVPADQPQGIVKISAAAEAPVGRHDVVLTTKLKFNDRDITAQRTIPLVIEAAAPPAQP
jgi:hypothetical protein